MYGWETQEHKRCTLNSHSIEPIYRTYPWPFLVILCKTVAWLAAKKPSLPSWCFHPCALSAILCESPWVWIATFVVERLQVLVKYGVKSSSSCRQGCYAMYVLSFRVNALSLESPTGKKKYGSYDGWVSSYVVNVAPLLPQTFISS